MRLSALFAALVVSLAAQPESALARNIVDASQPQDVSVTIYRDSDRDPEDRIEQGYPEGLALISETRIVTLPAGESTIRFIGVAEGMIGVSAIVTGLPQGAIEKNRNAQLLSPASLVNGALGNRVTITRTNPVTGKAVSEQAIVRTRADGGIVLQHSQGYEAVRCAGLPEKLSFNRVPDGLSAQPVFSVNTRSETGGTYEVVLTYLSWGFDWQADYVATLKQGGDDREFTMQWLSWLSLINDNGQSFNNARLQIVAGELNLVSDFEDLADPPDAPPLRLNCYPIGSTATGTRPPPPPAPPMPPPPAMMMAMEESNMITVTARRREAVAMDAPLGVAVATAREENLGDLKLFRMPERVDVSAKGMKQVAFLSEDEVKGRFLYLGSCDPYEWMEDQEEPEAAQMLLVTKNDEEKGLGIALPQGAMTVFEPTSRGLQLAGSTNLRDYARGQDVELELGNSSQVFVQCARADEADFDEQKRKWRKMRGRITNANPHDIYMRINLSWSGDYDVRFPRKKVRVKNGFESVEVKVPANSSLDFKWKLRPSTID